MFSNEPKAKKRSDNSPAVHTLLGKDVLFKGDIHAGTHSLRIEGTVEGTIDSEGEVIVAPTGVFRGTIHAKNLIVTGKIIGVFHVSECLEIHGTGWVEGEVELGSLVVDEGGTLQGTCVRRGLKDAPQKAPRHEDRTGINGTPAAAAGATDHGFAKPFEAKKASTA